MHAGKLVFAQLVAHLPLHTFRQCVANYPSRYPTLTFSHLDQFLCLAFAQLTYRESLRDIETCLRAHQAKLYHLGIRGNIAKSTLADANESRDWRIYQDFALSQIKLARKLYSQDSFAVETRYVASRLLRASKSSSVCNGRLMRMCMSGQLGAIAAGGEKTRQELSAFCGKHTTRSFGMMVQARLGKQVQHAARHAGFRIRRTEHHPRNARMHDCPGAHHAGFQRHVQRRARQPVIAQPRCRIAQGHHLGMRRRIVSSDRLIETAADNLSVQHDHSTYRHFACRTRQRKRFIHPEIVIHSRIMRTNRRFFLALVHLPCQRKSALAARRLNDDTATM